MEHAALLDTPARGARREREWRAAATLSTGVIALIAAAPIAVYLWVALHRVGYAYELDWMEGGSVELAGRVLAGHSLYPAPSIAFVGWTYPPLYYWVSAAVAKVIGLGFLPLRLVSLAASLATMATLAWIVTRETGDRIAGLVAAGLFAATFRISGAWFDTGRVDSLFLALTLMAIATGRHARGVRGGIGLGTLAFLAFLTKQTALIALAPALAVLLVTRRKAGIPAVVTVIALIGASTAVLEATTGGWYGYYIYSELIHQQVAQTLWMGFWRDDIWHQQWPLVILVLVGAAAVAWRTRKRPRDRANPAVYYALAAAGLIGSAWVSRLHTGGYANVLMPAYAAIALLTGLFFAALGTRQIARALLGAAIALQLALLAYPIARQIPTGADRRAGAQLIARLRALPGPVIVLRHPWYATEAGKGTFAQEEAIGDVLRSTSHRGARPLAKSLSTALDRYRVRAVVLDGGFDAKYLEPELSREFRLQRAPITPTRLYPLTDVRTSPTLLYLRAKHHR
ncbi:MAG TPA: glycosyltransferase family 39 protein [Solirubrobacteraceae bacterium]|nr:glycosyltransferase family 39 protein [Solirubrobacteraceae bacterium]